MKQQQNYAYECDTYDTLLWESEVTPKPHEHLNTRKAIQGDKARIITSQNEYEFDGEKWLKLTDFAEFTLDKTLALRLELAEILKWYSKHDYYPNKITTGEWLETDERWVAYKAERLVKRQRKDELKALLLEMETGE